MQGDHQPPKVLKGPFPADSGCFFARALGKSHGWARVSLPSTLTSFPNFLGCLWLLHQSKEVGAGKVIMTVTAMIRPLGSLQAAVDASVSSLESLMKHCQDCLPYSSLDVGKWNLFWLVITVPPSFPQMLLVSPPCPRGAFGQRVRQFLLVFSNMAHIWSGGKVTYPLAQYILLLWPFPSAGTSLGTAVRSGRLPVSSSLSFSDVGHIPALVNHLSSRRQYESLWYPFPCSQEHHSLTLWNTKSFYNFQPLLSVSPPS